MMEALGRFRLRREIGAGRWATVYEAHDGSQPCALKVFREDAVPAQGEAHQQIVQKLSGLRQVEHPSVVKVFDAGEEAGRVFISMEIMQCPSLAQKLQQTGRLDEIQAVLFVRQTAQALDRARDLGFGHGSLCPRNVFVVSEEKVKVTDFGIAGAVCGAPGAQEAKETQQQDEWLTAQELMLEKGESGSTDAELEQDFVGLAALLLRMLGVALPEQEEGEEGERYRERLRALAYDQLTGPRSDVSVHTADVVRRLLTPGEFGSPGEVVVELASAMLLRRSTSKSAREGTAIAEEPPPDQESEVVANPVPDTVGNGLELLEFQGDPCKAAYTPFFAWDNRRNGRFFVIYDGERLTVGRDPEIADVALLDPAVSRKHCILSKDGGTIRIEDLGSANGTFLNEQRITSCEIHATDSLRIGATRVFMSLAARG